MASGLKPLVTAFHRRLAKDMRFGMAVIHLKNPADAGTWKLVGVDSLASRLVGTAVRNFITLPTIERNFQESSRDLQTTYRAIYARGTTMRLGHIRPRTKVGASELYAVTAIALPRNRVGLVFENETTLRNTTKELLEAKTRSDEMCKTVKAILWHAHPDTLEFTSVSEEAEEILGYWTERWKHETCFWRKHTHPDDWDMLRQQCSQVVNDGENRRFDFRMTAADGRELWVHLSVYLNELPRGATELSGVMVDITDRKRVEEASRKLALHALKQSETEHQWLNQELDSGIGLHLAALKVSLASLQHPNSSTETEMQQKLEDCLQLVQTCMDDLCSVSLMLRPPFLDERGLLAALQWYTEIFCRWSGMEIEMDIPEALDRLGAANEIVLFRFAQECLRNVHRHSGTNHAVLRLREAAEEVVMEIEDTGFGIAADVLELLESGGYSHGIGLTKLRERVRELDGTVQIHTGTMGTIVCARVPRAEKTIPAEASPGTTFPLRP